MPWLNANPSDATSAEEAVTAGDVEPTTEDFEAMFDQIDIAGDFDWESVTEDESDFQNVDEEEEVCENTDNGITDDWGDDCEDYAEFTEWCGLYDSGRFKSMEMCCACKEIDGTNPYAPDDLGTCEDNMDVEDVYGDDCSEYWGNEDWCGLYDFYGEGQFSAFDAFADCCACQALTGDAYIEQLHNIADNWGMNNPDEY